MKTVISLFMKHLFVKFLLGVEISDALKNYINKPIEIGIRPEDIFITEKTRINPIAF